MDKKTKILTLSDHPLSPSGVGTQTKYVIEALLKTGKYQFISLGGAIKHQNYNPVKTEEWGDDWVIYPVNDYGTQDMIRSILRNERPDMLWFMTDPRFWHWLWQMEHEIRPLIPMVYYHVWDNYPYPKFNRMFYDSNDVIATISKVTDDIVRNVAPDVECVYVPHTVDTDVFKKLPDEEVAEFKKQTMPDAEGKFVFFWNNRNARRKQSGTLIWWFNEFLNRVGRDKAILLMHTAIKDPNGQDLEVIIKDLGLLNGEVLFSEAKIPPENLNQVINIADCTINISDAEGFGLATLESLATETPIVVSMTGGLQQQVTDGKEWFGIGIEPSSKAIIGSQAVPYIYEDRLAKEDFVEAMVEMFNKTQEERNEMGRKGRAYVESEYSPEEFAKNWESLVESVVENRGSWSTRKNYQNWKFKEVG